MVIYVRLLTKCGVNVAVVYLNSVTIRINLPRAQNASGDKAACRKPKRTAATFTCYHP
jgi:hypothetical protein